MSSFSPRPPGTVMHGEFHDFRQAVRALRVLQNAGYARAEIKAVEPQRDEPTVVVVDAAARGAARAAEILAEHGAQMRLAPKPSETEHSEAEAIRVEQPQQASLLQQTALPQKTTLPGQTALPQEGAQQHATLPQHDSQPQQTVPAQQTVLPQEAEPVAVPRPERKPRARKRVR